MLKLDNQHVRVWDVGNQQLVYTYLGHTNEVRSLAWSPDSKRIASASGDETVQVWDATTGDNVVTYHHLVMYEKYDPSHPQYDDPWAVAWSPDGQRIASGYLDGGGVQIWNSATGMMYRRARTQMIIAITLLLGAWALALRPYIAPPYLTIRDAASNDVLGKLLLGMVIGAAVLLLASLYLPRLLSRRKTTPLLEKP